MLLHYDGIQSDGMLLILLVLGFILFYFILHENFSCSAPTDCSLSFFFLKWLRKAVVETARDCGGVLLVLQIQ